MVEVLRQTSQEILPFGEGVPFYIESIRNPELGVGGAYGAWGEAVDNASLIDFLAERGKVIPPEKVVANLSELGFDSRYLSLSPPGVRLDLELDVGERFCRAAAEACGWKTTEVDALLLGLTAPEDDNYTVMVAERLGMREEALKGSFHTACDSSVRALSWALKNSDLVGRKVLVGGVEGLSDLFPYTDDALALQLFANGAGVIGIVPGETFKPLVVKQADVGDERGVLAAKMTYSPPPEGSLVGVTWTSEHHVRVAGLMPEPENGAAVYMREPMAMVRYFVAHNKKLMKEAYEEYRNLMFELGTAERDIVSVSEHHANLKIIRFLERALRKDGLDIPIPWLLDDFGNVSAASPMIAFLRQQERLEWGDDVMIVGFGAGGFFDVVIGRVG